MIYAVFGVGIGNFKVRRWGNQAVPLLKKYLGHGTPEIEIVASFKGTGNFLADSPSTNLQEVAARFDRVLGTDWVVRPIDDVRAALIDLEKATEPTKENRIRWTPGLAFCGDTGISRGPIEATPRAVLWMISPCTIGAFKRDNLRADGTLDRNQRNGGWGAISGDISRQIGGRWTSRSRGTIDKLLQKDPTAKTDNPD